MPSLGRRWTPLRVFNGGGGGNVSVSPWGDPAILARSLAGQDRASRVQPSSARLVEPSGFSSAPSRPNKNGTTWVPFVFGGGGGNRTPVRKPSTVSSTYLAVSFDLTRNPPTGRLVASDPLGFRPGPRGGDQAYFLLFMTLLLVLPSPTRRPIGAASGLKRPERKIRRWRLSFYRMDLRGGPILGMP